MADVNLEGAGSGAGLAEAWCGWCLAVGAAERGELRTVDGRGVCLVCSLDSLNDSKRTGRPRWRFVDDGHFGTDAHKGGMRWVGERLELGAAAPNLAPLGGEGHFLCVAGSVAHVACDGEPGAGEGCASVGGCGFQAIDIKNEQPLSQLCYYSMGGWSFQTLMLKMSNPSGSLFVFSYGWPM